MVLSIPLRALRGAFGLLTIGLGNEAAVLCSQLTRSADWLDWPRNDSSTCTNLILFTFIYAYILTFCSFQFDSFA